MILKAFLSLLFTNGNLSNFRIELLEKMKTEKVQMKRTKAAKIEAKKPCKNNHGSIKRR